MILVAGGTGHLGTVLVPLLVAQGHEVKVLTRDPAHARSVLGDAAVLAAGDVRDPSSLPGALRGVGAVVSAITGFGPGGPGPSAIDREGNLNLIQAAVAAGVDRFVLVSIRDASAAHPMELLREKHRAEQALRASELGWTIVRPTVFMELWAGIIGDPIVTSGKTVVFGPGTNPVNFVSVHDVAAVVSLVLQDPAHLGRTIDVGGPESPTLMQLVQQIEQAINRKARVRHIPVPVMRVSDLLLRLLKPDIAGLIWAGVSMATINMAFDARNVQAQFPGIKFTPVTEAVRRRFATDGSSNHLIG